MKKKILITGAGTGIGKATAVALSRRGHDVVATTETEDQSIQLREELKFNNNTMTVFKLDITNENDRKKINDFDIDVLINNAGIGESGSLAEIAINRVRQNFEVNVFAALELSQLALNKMLKKQKGTILFVSSLAAKVPMPFLAPYAMTKAALSIGAKALRTEIHKIAPDIHVSIIEPGAYHTGFNQKNIAKKYTWMMSDSPFSPLLGPIRKKEEWQFKMIEVKSTASIVHKIVKAAEARKPRLRYSAPWWQALGVYLLCLTGR